MVNFLKFNHQTVFKFQMWSKLVLTQHISNSIGGNVNIDAEILKISFGINGSRDGCNVGILNIFEEETWCLCENNEMHECEQILFNFGSVRAHTLLDCNCKWFYL